MTRLILIRCAITDWNKVRRIQGTIDVPLNDDGKIAAVKLGQELSRIHMDALYSSLLLRSMQTAEIIGQQCGLKVNKRKELNELDQGLWQGLFLEDIKKRHKKQYGIWKSSPLATKPPQGEGVKDAIDRIAGIVKKITDKHRDQTVGIVSHEVVIALIKCICSGRDVKDMWDVMPGVGTWEVVEAR